jgi:ferric-dicitrate binding protein FerR (iron transport regulator)
MGTRTSGQVRGQSGDRLQRIARRVARPSAWAIRIVVGGALLWITYLVSNPPSLRGRIVGAWDSVARNGMQDVVSPLKRWELRRLPDGTVTALEWGTWVRYPRQSDAHVHRVYLEGTATFFVALRGAWPFEVSTPWGTIRSAGGPVAFRVGGAPSHRCSVSSYIGDISATVASSSGATPRTVPEGWWLDCTVKGSDHIAPGTAPPMLR